MRYTYKLKELAKELCEKSGCHHKCHDTSDCVVEDEALLLINENKSNNFDVKSNNELVPNRNELPSTLTNEDKVSVKDREIEEMANDLYENRPYRELWIEDAQDIAEVLYNAGYRKQSEGEWIFKRTYYEADECNCSICEQLMTTAKGVRMNYCPNCGAKMKGGE